MRVGRAVSKEEDENTRQFSLYVKYMIIGWWVLLGGCGGPVVPFYSLEILLLNFSKTKKDRG